MVKQQAHRTRHRPAIAMIELIFALVIMGIALMSAPMLISSSTSSSYATLQQETIATTASQIQTIMTAMWDEQDTNLSTGCPVLQTSTNSCTAATPPGVTSSSGRYCKKAGSGTPYSATPPMALGPDSGDLDDIDDYDRNGTALSATDETTTTPEGDYIDTHITVTATVKYSTGTATAPGNPFTISSSPTDIKFITVRTTSTIAASELNKKDIRLSAFMCNIGAPKEILTNKGSL